LKEIELDDDFRIEVKALSKEDRSIIGSAISDIQEAFGNPHVHSGIGLRKLKPRLYEAGLTWGNDSFSRIETSAFSFSS
jgi:hypothetical protein